jgi:hypothetical protein
MDEARKSAFFRHPVRWLKAPLGRMVRGYRDWKRQTDLWAGLGPASDSGNSPAIVPDDPAPEGFGRRPLRPGRSPNVGSHLDTYA